MEREAAELFEEFKELTASEFFRRNKQMLGFSGKIRSLTIVFHELITNSLDAAEEAGILPEIKIDLKRLEKDHYILKHQDNGPGSRSITSPGFSAPCSLVPNSVTYNPVASKAWDAVAVCFYPR